MDTREIALHLTIKTIEADGIEFYGSGDTLDTREKANEFNAKQISDFYNSLMEKLL